MPLFREAYPKFPRRSSRPRSYARIRAGKGSASQGSNASRQKGSTSPHPAAPVASGGQFMFNKWQNLVWRERAEPRIFCGTVVWGMFTDRFPDGFNLNLKTKLDL
jgi:hypothetical protein